ncbi:MAG TPA: glycogen debranching protein [Acidobacteriota bacterium]|nr:glycogen debranching protein [Acidobacteriota bacterium]
MLAPVLLAPALLLHPVARFPMPDSSLTITRRTHFGAPFTVAGEHGAILGEEDGHFEAWNWPVKMLSRLRISAELADYPVPVDVNALADTIQVNPGWSTITYSHAAFTVRQHMLGIRGQGQVPDEGAVVFFEIASVRPLRLTFRFSPDVMRMWPAANYGPPDAEWKAEGYYLLHTNDAELSAAVGMPRAVPGIMPPYQERPQTYPVELKLSFDPKQDSGLFFPLLMAAGGGNLGKRLSDLNGRLPELFLRTREHYEHLLANSLIAGTPDPEFDRSLQWAEISIDQSRVAFHGETGLVAGYYESGDSARPGFGWFFGRDALWTSFALNSCGNHELTREALEFLIRRQRADGKIMHEYSQTADLVDWKALPYFYAAADSTPLFLMAAVDYVNASGDVAFLRKHWDAVKRAYAFTRTHAGPNGIYTNEEGTGWVESWPPGMPYQEVYLASLDQQSAAAMARLAGLMKDGDLARSAEGKSDEIRKKIANEFYDSGSEFYAFSRAKDGTLDRTATIYPAVAWWDGHFSLPRAGPMLSRWASPEFSTDWGVRDLSERAAIYDPISYHQGSVWPLFTGWVALAEYRAGRPLAGYQHLMQNADLTWAQDLGAVTELLSGEFFQPLGRSSAHQTWSSAMVLTPALRGLFGLEWDAPARTLRIAPNLPADWDRAVLRNVRLGGSSVELSYRRDGGQLVVEARSAMPESVCLATKEQDRAQGCSNRVAIPLPAVEIALPHGLPLPGSTTEQLKVIDQQSTADQVTVTFEAQGDSIHELRVRLNRPGVRVSGAELAADRLRVRFPHGSGFQHRQVIFELPNR